MVRLQSHRRIEHVAEEASSKACLEMRNQLVSHTLLDYWYCTELKYTYHRPAQEGPSLYEVILSGQNHRVRVFLVLYQRSRPLEGRLSRLEFRMPSRCRVCFSWWHSWDRNLQNHRLQSHFVAVAFATRHLFTLQRTRPMSLFLFPRAFGVRIAVNTQMTTAQTRQKATRELLDLDPITHNPTKVLFCHATSLAESIIGNTLIITRLLPSLACANAAWWHTVLGLRYPTRPSSYRSFIYYAIVNFEKWQQPYAVDTSTQGENDVLAGVNGAR